MLLQLAVAMVVADMYDSKTCRCLNRDLQSPLTRSVLHEPRYLFGDLRLGLLVRPIWDLLEEQQIQMIGYFEAYGVGRFP